MAFFGTPHPMISPTETARQCHQNLTLLNKFITSFIRFLKVELPGAPLRYTKLTLFARHGYRGEGRLLPD